MKAVDWERAAVMLVDCEAQVLYGVYVPSQVGLDLEPSALGGGFPAQAEVRDPREQSGPLELNPSHLRFACQLGKIRFNRGFDWGVPVECGWKAAWWASVRFIWAVAWFSH